MSESYFCYFPHDRNRPKYSHVSDQNSFVGPSKEMTPSENIHVWPYSFCCDITTVDTVILYFWLNWTEKNEINLNLNIENTRNFNYGWIRVQWGFPCPLVVVSYVRDKFFFLCICCCYSNFYRKRLSNFSWFVFYILKSGCFCLFVFCKDI